jgi:purine nucleosidase
MTTQQEAWWIDCDPGVDDACAIMMACAQKKNIVGISVTFGNAAIELAIKNVLKLLEIMNKKIPVYPGSQNPLCSTEKDLSDGFFGKDAFGDSTEYNHVKGFQDCLREENGALAMIKASKEAKAKNQRFIVVALAPLTTVAVAIGLDHTLNDRVDSLFVMGGAISGQGFTMMSTEFNFDRDPEAAHKTLECFDNIIIVPIETEPTAKHTLEETLESRKGENPLGKFWKEISKVLVENRGDESAYFCAIFDAVCMACAIDETVITKSIKAHGIIDITGRHTRGNLILEKLEVNEHHDEFYGIDSKIHKKKEIRVVVECDRKKLISYINHAVLKYEDSLLEAV